MASNDFSNLTQYEIGKIEIDGNDVIGLFQSISVYEDIHSPIITGSIVLLDSDDADFLAKYKIEGSEEFKFEFTNSQGEQLTFEGVLNGMRNKTANSQNTIYTFDFTSPEMRKNEETHVTKRYNSVSPKEVISEMIEKVGGKEDKVSGSGKPMSFIGARKRPRDIMQYVLTHGVSEKSNNTEQGKSQNEEHKGTTGFLCWQTLDGYRFCSVDDALKGEGGTNAGEFKHQMQNHGLSMEESMNSILTYDFKFMGDIQSKMRSGAFKHVVISFDMDKGLYKEYEYKDENNMTEKQKKAGEKPTRYIWKPYTNEVFEPGPEKAQDGQWDQSRQYLGQNVVRQNTFTDQAGTFTLPPRFKIRAGDYFEAKIAKVEGEKPGGYNEKHSGRYVIKRVGHHLLSDGRAYTKVHTLRSTIQQDDASSKKS